MPPTWAPLIQGWATFLGEWDHLKQKGEQGPEARDFRGLEGRKKKKGGTANQKEESVGPDSSWGGANESGEGKRKDYKR